jgi:glucose dehydrogenase
MDRLMQAMKRVQVATVFGLALLAATRLNAENQGATTKYSRRIANIHLVLSLADGRWTMRAGDYGNTRYSPLDRINTGNGANLHVVGTMSTGIPQWVMKAARWSWAVRFTL